MSKISSNGNGQLKSMSDLEGKAIEFPVTFELKAVMQGSGNDTESKSKLAVVFLQFKVKHDYLHKKVSSKGTYTSFTFRVNLKSRKQMDDLYAALKGVDGLKFAV